MALRTYTKQRGTIYRPKGRVLLQKKLAARILLLHRFAPLFLIGIGVFLLSSVLLPMLFGEFLSTNTQVGAVETVTPPIQNRERLLPTPKPTPLVIAQELPFIDLRNWFPNQEVFLAPPTEEKTYTLSVPKIGIFNAKVVVGGQSLDQHLIHFPKTAYPGEKGTAVIFGHSVLRTFYNPKESNPRRYVSIFSTIMTLKVGDEIRLLDDSVLYTYRVTKKEDVLPTDSRILEQSSDQRQLRLVTCTPEGTTLRRGLVTAVLDDTLQ